MKPIKAIGLSIFLFSMALFIAIGLFSRYEVEQKGIDDFVQNLKDSQRGPATEALMALSSQNGSTGKFSFYASIKEACQRINQQLLTTYSPSEDVLNTASEKVTSNQITEESYNKAIGSLPENLQKHTQDWTGWLQGKEYENTEAARAALLTEFKKAGDNFASKYQLGDLKAFRFNAAKAFGTGWFWNNKGLIAILTLLLGSLGALMYIVPAFFDGMPGIKHNGIYFSSATNRGLIGIIVGVFLVGFYILLYFYHDWIVEWISLTDPVAQLLRGEDASQWFMYGLLYTIAIAVMGVRMFAKYRHSNYHKIRTASIIFFQVAFAFLIPQILYTLNLPDSDLKNAWPLNYYFFFDWNIAKHIDAGTIGIFMLVWGIVLSAILVPLLTYFYGKRWYCSWVCGCGGLAETLGDPYRQLSDKSLKAWRIERWLIHGVLVFAVVMTIATLLTFLINTDKAIPFWLTPSFMLVAAIIVLATAGVLFWKLRYNDEGLNIKTSNIVVGVIAVIVGIVAFGLISINFSQSSFSQNIFFIDSYKIRSTYGFAIGSIFAGVVGTGFYPVMGNRVWCRFGCPLAAYMGLVQRFKSRFRITTNGGQCISCGNCSTYCEMGIDVRWYAQRGQNIVRSSCVGCGVCAAVCPRGVLALENGPAENEERVGKAEY